MIVPDSDTGDLWLRRMENPSHDSLSYGQLKSEEDRQTAIRQLKRARRELSEIIERKSDIDRYGEASNIDELADILPDIDDTLGNRTLTTRIIETRPNPFGVHEAQRRLKSRVAEKEKTEAGEVIEEEEAFMMGKDRERTATGRLGT